MNITKCVTNGGEIFSRYKRYHRFLWEQDAFACEIAGRAIIDNKPYISVINTIEVPGFSVVNREILDFIDTAIVLGLTDSIVEQTINIRKTLRIKLPDAIIAATAIDKRMHLVTRNTTDFEHIKGLRILNPWDESNGEIFSP